MTRFFIVQFVSALLSWGLVRWRLGFDGAQWVLTQALLAALFSVILRHPRWWLPMHLAFFPALMGVSQLHLPRYGFGLAFMALALVYWSTFRSRVPLYLTHQSSLATLTEWVALQQPQAFADAGCGTGTVLVSLARRFPLTSFEGWEIAPLPWLIGRMRTYSLPNCHIRWGSFWPQSLARFDMVYAFLSPVPMPLLWDKACREMKCGTLLVSNSFAVPDEKPWRVLDEGSTMPLYVYLVCTEGSVDEGRNG